MPNYLSPAIGNAFILKNGEALPQMTVHKLTYFAHGWNLAINNEPLVQDLPEAWDNGPVFRTIWDKIRDYGVDQLGLILDPSRRPYQITLSSPEQAVIDHVWSRYHHYSSRELSAMTHRQGTPWAQIYFDKGRNNYIPNNIVKAHYKELAEAGRGK